MNQREIRGKEIVQKQDQIIRIDQTHYKVNSQSRNKQHDVIALESGWSCSCEDRFFRKTCCKHIHAIEYSQKIREEVRKENSITIEPISISRCVRCSSSDIVKHGVRHNKSGDIQRFSCKNCHKCITINYSGYLCNVMSFRNYNPFLIFRILLSVLYTFHLENIRIPYFLRILKMS